MSDTVCLEIARGSVMRGTRRNSTDGARAHRTMLATAPVAIVGSLAGAMYATPAHATAEQHVVEEGDTITRIAIRNGLRTIDVLVWNGLRTTSTIHPGQVLRLTPPSAGSVPVPAPSDPTVHTVAAGETIWSIARQHGMTVEALLAANGLKASAVIYPGQKLALTTPAPTPAAAPAPAPAAAAPAPAATTHTVAPGETVWAIARQHGMSVQAILSANGISDAAVIHPGQQLRIGAAPAPVPAAATTAISPAAGAPEAQADAHVVEVGETLWAIAQKHGVAVSTLLRANGLSDGAIIYPGQKLLLSMPQPAAADAQRHATLDAEQTEHARLIIRVGREVGASDRAIATALATAMVESELRNVHHGDRDSLGLFQQRPSQGWGTPEQILDPARATKAFFGGRGAPNGGEPRGLYDIAGWEGLSFGDAAQAVQISAFPERYGQWEQQAYAWLATLG